MRRARQRGARRVPDGAHIDALFGLEPVFEPGATTAAALGEFAVIDCPYCGESYDTPVDLSAGPFTCVEDCQVCCQPIELEARVAEDGTLASLAVRRLD
jgi:hypothetical protein